MIRQILPERKPCISCFIKGWCHMIHYPHPKFIDLESTNVNWRGTKIADDQSLESANDEFYDPSSIHVLNNEPFVVFLDLSRSRGCCVPQAAVWRVDPRGWYAHQRWSHCSHSSCRSILQMLGWCYYCAHQDRKVRKNRRDWWSHHLFRAKMVLTHIL